MIPSASHVNPALVRAQLDAYEGRERERWSGRVLDFTPDPAFLRGVRHGGLSLTQQCDECLRSYQDQGDPPMRTLAGRDWRVCPACRASIVADRARRLGL